MHIFLTGASGYLGSRVAAGLIRAGHTVTGLVRRSGSAPEGVMEALGDLGDTAALGATAAQADAVIHTAFSHAEDFGAAIDIEKAAIDAMIEALRGSGKPVIVASAVGVLGDTGAAPATDDAPVSADFPARIRGHLEDRTRADADGVRMSALRLSVLVYGHGSSQFVPMLMAAARRDGVSRFVAPGDNRLSSVHVDDAAAAFVAALERGQAGQVYNLASETVTGRVLAEAVAQGAGGVEVVEASMDDLGAATHPFAALLLSMNFDMDAAATRTRLAWTPSGPSLTEDISQGSYAQQINA